MLRTRYRRQSAPSSLQAASATSSRHLRTSSPRYCRPDGLLPTVLISVMGMVVAGVVAACVGSFSSPQRADAAELVPANALDLTNWKLTLPIAATGSSTAMEIKQPQLAAYSIDPYFMVDSSGAGVQFRAPVGGARTSGSSYPRSELREMTGGGTQKASWSTSVGKHTMTVTEGSTHLPAVKSQVVTAQIHDASDDVIEVVADGTRSNAPGTYSICLRYNGRTQNPCMDLYYTSGTRYTVRFNASGGHIKVLYNGIQKYDFKASRSGCYFKAGAYTQSNPSKGDLPTDYGNVIIYGLKVTHS
jgi:hypothetical protein